LEVRYTRDSEFSYANFSTATASLIEPFGSASCLF
jgi:hypothetical protein